MKTCLLSRTPGRQRFVTNIGNAQHFKCCGGVRDRAIALDAAGVQPGKLDAVFLKPSRQTHVVWKQHDVFAAEPHQALLDIVCNGLVTFPRTGIVALIDDGAVDGLVTAIDDGDAHAWQQNEQPGS